MNLQIQMQQGTIFTLDLPKCFQISEGPHMGTIKNNCQINFIMKNINHKQNAYRTHL